MEYDVVIALGHGNGDLPLTEQSKIRVETALDSLGNGTYKICLSGRASEKMLKHIGNRVEYTDIYVDDLSEDTVGNAVFTKLNFAVPEGWKNILVVSSESHIPRVRKIFNFVYGPNFHLDFLGVFYNENGDRSNEIESLLAFDRTFRGINSGDDEAIDPGDDKAIVKRLFERHSCYEGRQDLIDKLEFNLHTPAILPPKDL